MKKVIFVLALLCFLGCKEESNIDWLQYGTVQLTKPLIDSSSRIIDSSVTLSAELRVPDVELYYTNDGSEPDKTSLKYNAPIQTNEAGLFKFKAFHADWSPSESSAIEIIQKGLSVDSIYMHTALTKSYSGKGSKTVVDNQKATVNHMDKNWIGFDTIISADLFFKESTYIKSANLGYLVSTGAWIFPPEEVQIWSSVDGKSFTELTSLNVEKPSNNIGPELESVSLAINAEVSALRLVIKNTNTLPDWHPGKGNKGWLFMDEWIFY